MERAITHIFNLFKVLIFVVKRQIEDFPYAIVSFVAVE